MLSSGLSCCLLSCRFSYLLLGLVDPLCFCLFTNRQVSHAPAARLPVAQQVTALRPISLLTLSLLTLLDSNFPVNPPWAWELHPLHFRLCLSGTLRIFVPRSGLPRNLCLIGSLTAALRCSKGWLRKYLNLVMGIACTDTAEPLELAPLLEEVPLQVAPGHELQDEHDRSVLLLRNIYIYIYTHTHVSLSLSLYIYIYMYMSIIYV